VFCFSELSKNTVRESHQGCYIILPCNWRKFFLADYYQYPIQLATCQLYQRAGVGLSSVPEIRLLLHVKDVLSILKQKSYSGTSKALHAGYVASFYDVQRLALVGHV
jgi:hypothetical protein